jgi:IclR family transcriptional regulator, acetate operon repressor
VSERQLIDAIDLVAEKEGDESSAAGSRSLDRPFIVLRVLEENRAPMRLSEISVAAQLHLATTQRLVNLLIKHGYVEREGVEYRLGVTTLLQANTFLHTNRVVQVAEPVLQELTASTRLTSTLSIRHELTQVLLLRVNGNPPLRFQLPVGERTSLVFGGARVLAAGMPAEELDQLLEGIEDFPLASGFVMDRGEFLEGLKAIRGRGYALGQGQHEVGTISVTVPVYDTDGGVAAAIQLSGMIEDIPIDVDNLVIELKQASGAITRRMT